VVEAPVGDVVGEVGAVRPGSLVGSEVVVVVVVGVGVADVCAGLVVVAAGSGGTTDLVRFWTMGVWSAGRVAAGAGRTSR
jgi:hypothetical protein